MATADWAHILQAKMKDPWYGHAEECVLKAVRVGCSRVLCRCIGAIHIQALSVIMVVY